MINDAFQALVGLAQTKTGIAVAAIAILIGGNVIQYYRVDALKTRNFALAEDLKRTKEDMVNLVKSAKMATEYVNTQCEGLVEFWEKILNENNKSWEEYLPRN